jgi:UDP-N-acetylenolpyruvoylglucosamine reductase
MRGQPVGAASTVPAGAHQQGLRREVSSVRALSQRAPRAHRAHPQAPALAARIVELQHHARLEPRQPGIEHAHVQVRAGHGNLAVGTAQAQARTLRHLAQRIAQRLGRVIGATARHADLRFNAPWRVQTRARCPHAENSFFNSNI